MFPKAKTAALATITTAMVAWTAPTFAQFGVPAVVTVPGSVTSDQPVEQATQDLDIHQLPTIVTSVTATTTGSQYQSNASFISNLDQTLFATIDPQNATQLMPVTQGLPCDSTTTMLTVARALQQTYQAAIANAQRQTQELEAEDFSTIANNIQAPALLAAMQGVGQAVLTEVQEQQYQRQQLAELTTVLAAAALHSLDTETRAQLQRQGSGC